MISSKKKVVIIMLFILFPIVIFSQTERWVYRYSGTAGYREDVANFIVYGADENLYAAGISWYDATKDDFTVISLTNLGIERWIYTYNGLADNNDEAYSVVYGEDGNIYVAGSCYGTDTTRDFTVISLTPMGTERWVYQDSGSGICARSVIYGADGNIYAVGESFNTDSNTDFFVISLTNAGSERWTYQYNGPGNNTDIGWSIVYGDDGNIYVAGNSQGNGTFVDATVISLTNSGVERWVYRYNGPANFDDYAYDVVYGNDGNIYAIGSSADITFDIIVVCLANSGAENWIYRSPIDFIDDHGFAGVYGADSNVYVAGGIGSSIPKFLVVSLTDSGASRWEYVYNDSTMGGGEYATSVIYAEGNIYSAGITSDSTNENNFSVISLTDSGSERWVYQYKVSAYGGEASSVVYGTDGNIYAAGSNRDSTTSNDFTVISLNPDIGVQEDLIKTQAIAHKSLQIDPNPFHNKTVISYFMERDIKNIVLKIYGVTGRLVKSFNHLTNHQLLFNQVTWDGTDDFGKKLPAGVYFVEFEAQNIKDTKKIILLK